MSFYVGTVGELVIIEAFVFLIWLKVLFSAVSVKDGALAHKKLLLTSIGLVLSSAAVFGIMGVRIYELEHPLTGPLWAVSIFYVLLGSGNFILLVSASLGTNSKIIRAFLAVTVLWTLWVCYRLFF